MLALSGHGSAYVASAGIFRKCPWAVFIANLTWDQCTYERDLYSVRSYIYSDQLTQRLLRPMLRIQEECVKHAQLSR